MVAKLPPSVRGADEADRPGEELRTAQHRQVRPSAKRAQNVVPLVFTKQAVVVRPCVDEMWRQQGEQAQPRLGGILEANVQNDRIAARVREHAIDDPESPAAMRARQAEGGNTVFDTFDDCLAVALDLGEESSPVGDDEAEVADASLVNARIVDFIDDAVTDGEPDAAPLAERCADPVLGARCPTRRNSRRPRRFDHVLPQPNAPVLGASPPSRQRVKRSKWTQQIGFRLYNVSIVFATPSSASPDSSMSAAAMRRAIHWAPSSRGASFGVFAITRSNLLKPRACVSE